MISRLLIIASLIAVITAESTREYLQSTGGLNDKEAKVNDIFLKYKIDELDRGFISTWMNEANPHSNNSKLIKYLKMLHKGALLHTHSLGSLSSKGFIKAVSYIPGFRRCYKKQGDSYVDILSFRQLEEHKCASGYTNINDYRINFNKEYTHTNYDKFFEDILNLNIIDVNKASVNTIWSAVENLETALSDAIRYKPAFRAYYRQLFRELYKDNIMYTEVRIHFEELYDNKTKAYPVNQTVIELIDVVKRFKLKHPDFLGIKMIYAANREGKIDEISKDFQLYLELQSSFPDDVIGFDLVGREYNGKPIDNFLDVFKDSPDNSKYFFNDDLYGASENLNISDAILSNSPRIGNGFTLTKNPMLLETVIKHDIAVEFCPISSLIFSLVNHPSQTRIAIPKNVNMVIGNDRAGFWHTNGLSYDLYYVLMGLEAHESLLETLKQLIYNSIKYSMLQSEGKKKAYNQLQTKWEVFIDNVLKDEKSVAKKNNKG